MPTNAFTTVERLHDAATGATGLTDFGDPAYLEPLDVLLDSYQREADLTPQGGARFADTLVGILRSKLRTQAAFREHPEYADNALRRPIFVTGLPRTGTTALHRLLCVDPHTQGLEHWLADWPQPRPPRASWPDQPGYQETQRWVDDLHAAIPDFKGVHFMSPEVVDECWRVERQVAADARLREPVPPAFVLPLDVGAGPAAGLRDPPDVLALIGLGSPHLRWVLKSPAHLHGLDALMSVYPDALVIQTHRDPRTAIASVSSLSHKASAGTSNSYTPAVVGRDCLEIWSRGIQSFSESRRKYDPAQFVDVDYQDFVDDAVGVVEDIYRAFELPFDADIRSAVQESHEASKVSERRPVHRYSLADFGLTEGQVDEAFAGYLSSRA